MDAIYLVRLNEQGQIAEHWGVVDTIGTMSQLGLLPAPDQAPPRTGPAQAPGRTGPCGPGRCWSWPPGRGRGVVRLGRHRAEDRLRPGPLPGIWPALRLDTAITLPIAVEAYAAYALRAWLARDRTISARTRRFVKWPKYRRGNAR
jgi:hypothetical protein